MTTGWGETEVLMDVSSRRLALVLHRHLAEHGLLSFLSLLRAFHLKLITANHGCYVPAYFSALPATFDRLGGFSGGVSLDEPILPASSLTRNTRNASFGPVL